MSCSCAQRLNKEYIFVFNRQPKHLTELILTGICRCDRLNLDWELNIHDNFKNIHPKALNLLDGFELTHLAPSSSFFFESSLSCTSYFFLPVVPFLLFICRDLWLQVTKLLCVYCLLLLITFLSFLSPHLKQSWLSPHGCHA